MLKEITFFSQKKGKEKKEILLFNDPSHVQNYSINGGVSHQQTHCTAWMILKRTLFFTCQMIPYKCTNFQDKQSALEEPYHIWYIEL